MKTYWLLIAAFAVSSAAGCTWVPLTPEAEQVHIATQAEVASCERLGKTDVRTTSKLWIFSRSKKKVQEEMTSLARTDAVDMGGTHIAPLEGVSEGSQSFGIYRCPGE